MQLVMAGRSRIVWGNIYSLKSELGGIVASFDNLLIYPSGLFVRRAT